MYLIWDFDGVIIDSNHIREKGFREVLKNYKSSDVESFIKYHRLNGGLSRYHKFNYFFDSILREDKTSLIINDLCEKYKSFMLETLGDNKFLIKETLCLIESITPSYEQLLVSASDESELKILSERLKIDHLFTHILGSPTSKCDNLNMLIVNKNIDPKCSIYIGDSINDKEAAEINGIRFIGYNNISLQRLDNINYAHSTDEIRSFLQ